MKESHVFLLDAIPAVESRLRGGKGLGQGRAMLGPDNAPQGSPFAKISVNTLPPGVSIGLHGHQGDAEVYVIISGSGLYTGKDGRKAQVKAGDVTVCYSGEEHALENTGAEPLVMAGIIA